MVLAFTCAASPVTMRTIANLNVPGKPNLPYYGLQDFRDAVYYPVISLLDGHNPYDASDYLKRYPVGNSFLYSPLALIVHLPFALFPPRPAAVIYHLLNLALMVLLASVALRLCRFNISPARVLGLAAALVLSRPGHMTLFIGQCTVYVVIGMYVALHFAASRPSAAAFGLALTFLKPTYGVPLAFLMWCRRDHAAVLIGAALAAAATAPVMALVIKTAGGLRPFLDSLAQSYLVFARDPTVDVTSSIYRIDTTALVAHLASSPLGTTVELAIATGTLGLGALGVRRLASAQTEGARLFSSILVCLTVLLCTYHQIYDALVLALPAVALAGRRDSPLAKYFGLSIRGTLLALIAVPAVNYLSTDGAIRLLNLQGVWWLGVTSASGAATLAVFAIFAAIIFRRSAKLTPATRS